MKRHIWKNIVSSILILVLFVCLNCSSLAFPFGNTEKKTTETDTTQTSAVEKDETVSVKRGEEDEEKSNIEDIDIDDIEEDDDLSEEKGEEPKEKHNTELDTVDISTKRDVIIVSIPSADLEQFTMVNIAISEADSDTDPETVTKEFILQTAEEENEISDNTDTEKDEDAVSLPEKTENTDTKDADVIKPEKNGNYQFTFDMAEEGAGVYRVKITGISAEDGEEYSITDGTEIVYVESVDAEISAEGNDIIVSIPSDNLKQYSKVNITTSDDESDNKDSGAITKGFILQTAEAEEDTISETEKTENNDTEDADVIKPDKDGKYQFIIDVSEKGAGVYDVVVTGISAEDGEECSIAADVVTVDNSEKTDEDSGLVIKDAKRGIPVVPIVICIIIVGLGVIVFFYKFRKGSEDKLGSERKLPSTDIYELRIRIGKKAGWRTSYPSQKSENLLELLHRQGDIDGSIPTALEYVSVRVSNMPNECIVENAQDRTEFTLTRNNRVADIELPDGSRIQLIWIGKRGR